VYARLTRNPRDSIDALRAFISGVERQTILQLKPPCNKETQWPTERPKLKFEQAEVYLKGLLEKA
jgi:hypothetical protein